MLKNEHIMINSQFFSYVGNFITLKCCFFFNEK